MIICAVSVWVCIASTVTTAPVRSKEAKSVRTAGISLDLALTATCPRTAPAWWSSAATKCGVPWSGSCLLRAPRIVLPSIAMTRRWSITALRVHTNAPISWSRTWPSTLVSTRLIVDSLGRSEPAAPSCFMTSWPWSATHSPIVVNERAPASTAAAVMAKTTGSACRTPRGSRGSGTAPSVASSPPGASCRAAAHGVSEDDIGGCGPWRHGECENFHQATQTTPVTHATRGVSPHIAAGHSSTRRLCRGPGLVALR